MRFFQKYAKLELQNVIRNLKNLMKNKFSLLLHLEKPKSNFFVFLKKIIYPNLKLISLLILRKSNLIFTIKFIKNLLSKFKCKFEFYYTIVIFLKKSNLSSFF